MNTYIHSTSTVTFSVSIPCWLPPLVGLMVLTAVHLYVPVSRLCMLGIVSIGPVRLKDLSLILVHSYRNGMGLDNTTLHVIFNVSPANILLSGMVCTVGGSVCLETILISNSTSWDEYIFCLSNGTSLDSPVHGHTACTTLGFARLCNAE